MRHLALYRSPGFRIGIRRWNAVFVVPVLCCSPIWLAGCGGVALNAVGSAKTVTTGVLVASSSAIGFGAVPIGQTANSTVSLSNNGSAAVRISQLAVTGQFFSVGNQPVLPLTVASGGSYKLTVQFAPGAAGAASGSLTIASNASNAGTATVGLSGSGEAAVGAIESFACATSSMTGAGTDACTVSLTAAAPVGGLTVNLSSSSGSVTVPGAVTVAAGATSAGFTASVAAITSTQTATLTASAAGLSKTFALELAAETPALSVSTTSLNFGDVQVNQPGGPRAVTLISSGTAPLTIRTAAVTGAGFTISGVSFPVTLNPGQTATLSIQFAPASAGAVSGAVTLSSNALSDGTAVIGLSGTGDAMPGVLNALSCSHGSMTGAGTDACTVSLTAAAPVGGLTVNLSSSSGSVTVPGAVTVAGGATSASFTASVAAVTSAQTATLTATAGSVSKTCALQLNAAEAALTLSSANVGFGSVSVNTPSTQSVTLTSSGTAPLTISAAAVTGAGFTLSGVTPPLTLNPGQTATLNIEFDPTSAGGATGSVLLTTNAASAAAVSIGLNGTGQAVSYEVDLTWNAPADSTDPIEDYNVYRAVAGSSSYTLVNTSPDSSMTYRDTTVRNGTAYDYMVESVDATGVESAPSNIYSVTIP